MENKLTQEYFPPDATNFNYNNVTGGADSASGGSGGSGMECLQIRSQPFHYLISEQAKSLVALQELQNEVGALLEFRDLVIETFPNLRSKMAPSTPAGGARRDWEPGVRVRRKLAAAAGEPRAKPQPSVQDSGFSTETSCGKDASASRSRPLEDELWALLDVIQRKGVRLREEAEMLRGELEDRHSQSQDTAEESFVRALSNGCGDCADLRRLRIERDALLAKNAQLEAEALISTPLAANTPLGRLDSALETPLRPPRLPTPDSKKFSAILQESNPLELQRQLLTSTVQNQLLHERLRRLSTQRSSLMERLERTKDSNEDLKFRLEEKSIELEGTRARLRQLEGKLRSSSNDSLDRSRDMHNSMRDMEPLHIPDGDEERISETPKRRPSRIPLHTSHKGTAPKPPSSHSGQPPRPPSAHSAHSVRSVASAKSRTSIPKPSPVRRTTPTQLDIKKVREEQETNGFMALRASSGASLGPSKQMADPRTLVTEYLARTERLAPLFPRLHTVRTRPLPADLMLQCKIAYETPQNLALELSKSILYENADSIDIKSLKSINSHCDSLWNGKPQRYFESMKFADDDDVKQYEVDSLTQ